MYIRIKERKNASGNKYKYAYLVAAKYRKKGPKQKVKGYLGRVYFPYKSAQGTFIDFIQQDLSSYLKKAPFKRIVTDIVKFELSRHAGKQLKNHLFTCETSFVDLKNSKIADIKTYKPTCLALNEGFLCDYTLKQIMHYKAPEAHEKAIGRDLAKKLTLAGLEVNQEVFLSLFKKLKNKKFRL